jgi:hypothetical protein
MPFREPNDVSQILFNVSNDLKNQTLTISITASNLNVCFKLYTDAEVVRDIRNYWTTVDPGNLRSANDIITHIKPMVRDSTFTTGFVNLNHINNVYITSPNLGSFDTLATFSNNVIKKVPVNAQLRLHGRGSGHVDERLPELLQADASDLGVSPARRSRTGDRSQGDVYHLQHRLQQIQLQICNFRDYI